MRCFTLANKLKQHGVQIRFISRHLPDYSCEILHKSGYEFIRLNSNSIDEDEDELTHSHWLGRSQEADAKETIKTLSDRVWDWIIVDHYALDARWEVMLRGSARHIFVIDDLADRIHDCDLLLDQNIYADIDTRYQNRVTEHTQLLLGPRYVLLREEFQRLRKVARIRTGSVKRLLVIFGGVDSDNYTGRVIEALINIEFVDLCVDVVIGAQHPFREQIISDCLRHGYFCHLQTNRIAELMSGADLAIGACGFTSYEIAAMQLPAILIPVTDIQAAVAKGLAERGIVYALFFQGVDIVEEIRATINKIINSSSTRTSMSFACRDFLDADGVQRVVNKILKYEIQ